MPCASRPYVITFVRLPQLQHILRLHHAAWSRARPGAGARLQAVHLDAALVVDVDVFALRGREELVVVQELHVAQRLAHLRATRRRPLGAAPARARRTRPRQPAPSPALRALCAPPRAPMPAARAGRAPEPTPRAAAAGRLPAPRPAGAGPRAWTSHSSLARCQSSSARCPRRPPSSRKRPLRVKSSAYGPRSGSARSNALRAAPSSASRTSAACAAGAPSYGLPLTNRVAGLRLLALAYQRGLRSCRAGPPTAPLQGPPSLRRARTMHVP